MNKNIFLNIFAALVITSTVVLLVSTNVFAQSSTSLNRIPIPRVVLGKITSIGTDRFAMDNRDGSQLIVKVSDQTRYRGTDKEELSFTDLQVGRWVAVTSVRQFAVSNLARLVVLLPEGFDPSQFEIIRGRITEILTNSFTLETPKGDQQVNVDSNTTYRGQVAGFSDLEEGMLAGVVAKDVGREAVLAKILGASYHGQKYIGEILSVNLSAGTFNLKTIRDSGELVFSTDSSTRFRSRDGKNSNLTDLKAGMTALVFTKDQKSQGSSGPKLALGVAAINKNTLPKFDQRFGGRITSLGKNEFTIENIKGEAVNFQVTGDTLFRIGLRTQATFDDLKEGMRVLVGAKEFGNSSYQAQVVVILPRR
jgi:Domain of unknown function (DUF5666)